MKKHGKGVKGAARYLKALIINDPIDKFISILKKCTKTRERNVKYIILYTHARFIINIYIHAHTLPRKIIESTAI